MKILRKISVIICCLLFALSSLLLGLDMCGLLSRKDTHAITNSDTTSYVKVGEIWNGSSFNANTFHQLLQMVANDSNVNMSKINSLASSRRTAANMRTGTTGKSSGKDIVVRFAGLDWEVMYLSKDKSGNPILTLWLTNNYQEAWAGRNDSLGAYHGFYNGGLYSDWSANWSSSNVSLSKPSNMYSRSYIHMVTLNNADVKGSWFTYSTGTSSTANATQSTSSPFAKFTMSSVTGNVTKYIVMPELVSWQESGQNSKEIGSWSYNISNESWSTSVSDVGFKSSSYNYAHKTNSDIWKYSYLWLPSKYEIGYTGWSGLWGANDAQRANFNGASSKGNSISASVGSSNSSPIYSASMTRSADEGSADKVEVMRAYGQYYDGDYKFVNYSYAVRPALHLNLAEAAEDVYKYYIDVNIMSPDGVQDYASGTMTYYNSYSGNTYYNQNNEPETILNYGGIIKISNIQPATGMEIDRVYITGGTNGGTKGTLTQSGGTYTYTLNKYSGVPYGNWEDEIIIQMKWNSITYNSNGGTYFSPQSYRYPGSVTLQTPTRYGYNFEGWKPSSSVGTWDSSKTYEGNSTLTNMYGSVTLNAQWTGKPYNIVYHSNNGTGLYTSETVKFGEYVMLKSSNTFSRAGYTFKCWANATSKDNVSSGNTYKEYNASSSYVMITKETGVELYAIWTPNSYTITFNVNGGQYLSSMSYTPESTSTLPTPRRIGYEFLNWSVSQVDEINNWNASSYSSGTSVKNKYGDVTLIANWKPKEWTLTFNPMGGNIFNTDGEMVSSMTRQVMIDKAYGSLPEAIKSGYAFKGWYTSSEGGDVVTSSTKMTTENATVYAQWIETWTNHASSRLEGSGTIDNPYLIQTGADLAFLSKKVQEEGSSIGQYNIAYYKQTAHIDLSNYYWQPIGGCTINRDNPNTAFRGIYDGGNYSISGINYYVGTNTESEPSYSYIGLFGYTVGATISNINLCYGEVYGDRCVGGLIGYAETGVIKNCISYVKVTGNMTCGMIGRGEGVTVTKCYNHGNIKSATYNYDIGGIIGGVYNLKSNIIDCIADCKVITVARSNNQVAVGGIIGRDDVGSTIQNSAFIGEVVGGYAMLGSSVGNTTIINCYAESNTGLYPSGESVSITSTIYFIGIYGYYYDGDFSNWTMYNGKPLPGGLTWIGGLELENEEFSLSGYTKIK